MRIAFKAFVRLHERPDSSILLKRSETISLCCDLLRKTLLVSVLGISKEGFSAILTGTESAQV